MIRNYYAEALKGLSHSARQARRALIEHAEARERIFGTTGVTAKVTELLRVSERTHHLTWWILFLSVAALVVALVALFRG